MTDTFYDYVVKNHNKQIIEYELWVDNSEDSNILNFLDTKGLYIGIFCDPDGVDWFLELCAIPLGRYDSREEAMEEGIKEAFKILDTEND